MSYIVKVGKMYVSRATEFVSGWFDIEIDEHSARFFYARADAEAVAEKVGGKVIEVQDD